MLQFFLLNFSGIFNVAQLQQPAKLTRRALSRSAQITFGKEKPGGVKRNSTCPLTKLGADTQPPLSTWGACPRLKRAEGGGGCLTP